MRALFISIILITALNSTGQVKPVLFNAVDSLLITDPKPVLILLSTSWCQYCQMQKIQVQKNKTFQESSSSFHYIEFDAESKEPIKFNKKTYEFVPSGKNIGTHALATTLNGIGRISYPTWILLDNNYQKLFQHAGMLLPKQLNELLNILKQLENQT